MPIRKKYFVAASLVGLSAAATIPQGIRSYQQWRDANSDVTQADYIATGDPESPWVLSPEVANATSESDETISDTFRRLMARRNYYGEPTAESTAQLAEEAQKEAQRWASQLPRVSAGGVRAKAAAATVSGLSWVNLGPDDAKSQYNGAEFGQVDSGRVNEVIVHPGNPDIVYAATAGGGIWKTFDFSAANPKWLPITETLGNLAIGALAIDPQHPETLYAGLGDFLEQPGGQLVKSTNGGATWSAPVSLSGEYDFGGAVLQVNALRFRSLVVDPNNSSIVLAGTDVGLFRSTDAGQSFSLVNLPNQGTTQVAESIWSIVYTGQVGGVSRWAISGMYAASQTALPPAPGNETSANPGDIWTSTDAGATWASRKAAGALPLVSVGRIDLGAGTPDANAVTVIYAQLASSNAGNEGMGYWRSMDSGQTWVNATGTLANPTKAASAHCQSVNVNSIWAYYSQAIAVDPADNNVVIVGGRFCGLRTYNGTATSPIWTLVSHWLPTTNGGGDTADGRLPRVHSGWHTINFTRTGSSYRVIAGTSGGLFVSSNVLAEGPVTNASVTWSFPNRGIVSHMFHSVASGDEVTGDTSVVYGGTQENGTRYRSAPATPTAFNQVFGGDGRRAAVVSVPGDKTYWASTNGSSRLCDPDNFDCTQATSWYVYNPTHDGPFACSGDSMLDFVSLVDIRTATAATGAGVLLATNRAVYRYKGDPFTSPDPWQLLGNVAQTNGSGGCSNTTVRGVAASSTVDGLYGAYMNSGRFRVTSNCTMSTSPDQCVWTQSSSLGLDLNADGTIAANETVFGTSSMDFPPGPTAEAPGHVFIASSVAPTTSASTPVPAGLGRVFKTTDGGLTWQRLSGNGTGFDLPNVPVTVVRYDPGDLTNNTIYAGTDLGLYRTTDGGQTWQRYGNGLPMVKVTDIFISRTGALLRIATSGRGLWEIYPSATALKGVSGNGDFDRNQQIDYLDVLSTANRMGTTPATQTAPLYDWNQDLTGTTNQIDDGDLSEVLTKFGGRP